MSEPSQHYVYAPLFLSATVAEERTTAEHAIEPSREREMAAAIARRRAVATSLTMETIPAWVHAAFERPDGIR